MKRGTIDSLTVESGRKEQERIEEIGRGQVVGHQQPQYLGSVGLPLRADYAHSRSWAGGFADGHLNFLVADHPPPIPLRRLLRNTWPGNDALSSSASRS